MLRWALGFLIVALMAAIVGFGGVVAEYAATSRIVFLVFLTLFAGTLAFSAAATTQSNDGERDDELTSD